MSKVFKWALAVVVLLVALVMLGVAVLFVVIDPNDYTSQAEDLVHEKTGMTLQLPEKLHWSIFPVMGVRTDTLILIPASANGESSDHSPASMTFEGVEVGLKPWAILKGELASDVSIKADRFSHGDIQVDRVRLEVEKFQLGAPFSVAISGVLAKGFPVPITTTLTTQVTLKLKSSSTPEDQLTLDPLSAHFNKSVLDGKVAVRDFAKPVMDASFESSQFNVSDWINLKGRALALTDSAITAHLTLDGTDKTQVPSTLNGEVTVKVTDILLKGTDLPKLLGNIRQALGPIFSSSGNGGLSMLTSLPSMLSSSTAKAETPGGTTDLGTFSTQALIHNGVVQNSHITLSGDHFNIQGSGQADLNQETLAYRFDIRGMQDKTPDKYAIPFEIKGKLTDPDMGINSAGLQDQIRGLLQDQLKNVVVQKVVGSAAGVAGQLQGLVGGLLGHE